jgi:hypothetical protein
MSHDADIKSMADEMRPLSLDEIATVAGGAIKKSDGCIIYPVPPIDPKTGTGPTFPTTK